MPTGIILLDKPQGLTSNAALQRVRKAYGAKSAGHVGTLDPMATGMLPLCLDEATKVIAEIESGAKCYEFTVQLGARTDTADAEGTVVERQPIPLLAESFVHQVLRGFEGPQQQVPPMYSALKREGRPLYELARQGIEVERAPRAIEIRGLKLAELGTDFLALSCECTKGTYIRVLGEDLARALGTVGHLSKLRRSWVEPFRDHPMVALDVVLARAADPSAAVALLPPDIALQRLPRVELDAPGVTQIRHGQPVGAPHNAFEVGSRLRLYGPGGEFIGLAEVLAGDWLQPRRLLRIDIV